MGIWRVPVVIQGPALPGPAANIWHVRTGETVGDAAYDDALQDAITALHGFYDAIKGLYPAGNAITLGEPIEELEADEPRVPTSKTFTQVSGTGGAGLPASDCLLVTWRSTLATRRGRGRSYIGPVVASAAEGNGTPEETNRSALQVAVDNLVAASSGTGTPPWAIGVYSPSDHLIRDIVSGTVPNKFGVLRSRRD